MRKAHAMTAFVLPILAALCLSGAAPVQAQGVTGSIRGVVLDDSTGKPLAYANVVVKNTARGSLARDDGSFAISEVPVGTHVVRVVMMGFESLEVANVRVDANRTTPLEIRLEESVVLEVDVVDIRTDAYDVLKKEESASIQSFKQDEAKIRAINTVEEAIATQAGVTSLGGELFVRGGRSGEIKTYVDGMPVSDAFAGSSGGTMEVSLQSLSELNMISGGMDAEYGNAQSAVIQIKTKEGTEKYTGQFKFMTDDFGAPDKTYFNYDSFSLGFGGPVPFTGNRLRFYASGEGTFSDTYLRTLEERPAQKLTFNDWELASFRDRKRNLLSGQGKLTYVLPGAKKISGEVLFSSSRRDWYHHGFSRVGYWSEDLEHWWHAPLDSTYTYYNGPAHLTDQTTKINQYKLSYTHPVSEGSYFKTRVAYFKTRYHEDVGGKSPGEYVPFRGNDRERDPENLFYAISGDFPDWTERESLQITWRSDYQVKVGDTHEFKTGATLDYYDLSKDDRYAPSEDNDQGSSPNQYSERAMGGVFYVQDRLRYKKSMVMNLGLRFDFFDPGESAIRLANQRVLALQRPTQGTSLLERWRAQVSPRVGMSYPISDRDVLHFHYGRFFQLPNLEWIFDYSDNPAPGNQTVGNAFLEPETTISYQFGVRRQLSDEVWVDGSVFFKDIFGLTGAEALEAENETEQDAFAPFVFINKDYGSVRGLELTLEKRFSHYWRGGLAYTLSKATGSSSDVLQAVVVSGEAADREPIKEIPLDWDRSHVFNMYLYLSDPGIWGVNADFSIASGSPTTPKRLGDRIVRAEFFNSIRLPYTMYFSMKANKQYSLYGQEFRLFVEGRNLLDRKNVVTVTPYISPSPANSYYQEYFTEFGELGGAYNLHDTMGTPDDILVPLNDPRVYGEPRSFRFGVAYEW
ncbi:MAG: TonB-dependent receptor [Gemmatimonadota bacterium]|nr:TonB-dependent receptor [Gemmatimonadota bacterium]MDP6802310.1 TonB-dependent receptor [Gemmatimonadota bacterium]MDP7031956.1 TonB-dependent receptor [Gemmatimonadota bacterium]